MEDIKFKQLLIRINRISAWTLLILMIAYIVTGYAWSQRIIMSPRETIYLAGLRRAEREGPTLQGGDESGALCPRIRLLITI
jgi:hypothetical protein